MMHRKIPYAAILLALAVPVAALADSWTWRMPHKYYQNLNFEKRAAIDRARDVYIRAEEARNRNKPVPDQIPMFRAAANEWKKFQVQFEFDAVDPVEDAVNAYVLFMQAYSLQGARDRNTAIKMYNELLDLFPAETWLTPAAEYMIGKNFLDNGEYSRAKRVFEDMIDTPEMLEHPLASAAYRHLGDYYWKHGKYTHATELWHEGTSKKYERIAQSDYNAQRNLLIDSYALLGKWEQLTQFLMEGIGEKNVEGRAKAIISVEDRFQTWWVRNNWDGWYWNLRWPEGKENDRKKYKKVFDQSFSKWHEWLKPVFVAADREWQWGMRAFRYRRAWSDKEARKMIEPLTALLKASPKKDMEARAKEYIYALADFKMFDEARTIVPLIGSPVPQLWMTYEIDIRAEKYDACVLTLETLIANVDPAVSLQGKKKLAWLYKDRIHDYEKAIKLYQDISNPPHTLWDIQECYRRMGKKAQAYATLEEIAFFPDQKAAAYWRMGEYYRDDGEKEKAIACYRRLLSQPELKKSSESSWAHQRLEAWGIATGGGVGSEVR